MLTELYLYPPVPMNILIVDDERPCRNDLERSLRTLGVDGSIEKAASVDEAIELINAQIPDVILLDIEMPGENGFDLLSRLGNASPPVIFTTAYEQFAARAFEIEAIDYLLKPFDSQRLAKALERIPLPDRKSPALTQGDSILLKLDGECLLLPVESIELVVTTGNTSEVFWGDCSGRVNKPLKYLVQRLDSSLFFRATRDQLINLRKFVSMKINDQGLVQVQLPHKRQVIFSRRQSTLFRKIHKL